MTRDNGSDPVRLGTMISELPSPNLPRILARAGFDFAILDCEHGLFNPETVGAMAGIAVASGFRLLLRCPLEDRPLIARALDAGVAGIIVPMVESAVAAQRAAGLVRYPPIGSRGVSTNRPHTGYGAVPIDSLMDPAGPHPDVYVQVETPPALDHLGGIARTPGLTGILLGPNDLGYRWPDAGAAERERRLEDAIRLVAKEAIEAGIESGVITGNPGLAGAALAAEMSMLCWGSELSLLIGAGRDARETVASLMPDRDRPDAELD